MSAQDTFNGRAGEKRPFDEKVMNREESALLVVWEKVSEVIRENWKKGCPTLERVGGMAFNGWGAKLEWETNSPWPKITITKNEDYDA